MVDIPRLTLPDAVTGPLTKDLGLKNPNDLSNNEYNSYSGAAILGTLVFYVTIGALITDNDIIGLVKDFVFSALTGGGILAYLSLRKDALGGAANGLGEVLSSLGDIPRIELPQAAVDALKDLDLKNPNELSTEEYNTYSYAAILGTLSFFLLPGAAVVEVDIPAIFTDFIFFCSHWWRSCCVRCIEQR